MSKSTDPPTQPHLEGAPIPLASTAVTPTPIARSTSRTSRIGVALASVRSIEAHPPHHAHFDLPVEPETPLDDQPSEKHRDIPTHNGQTHDGSGADRVAGNSVLDIEHMPCDDDPREWSAKKKNFVLMIMTVAVVSDELKVIMVAGAKGGTVRTVDRSEYI